MKKIKKLKKVFKIYLIKKLILHFVIVFIYFVQKNVAIASIIVSKRNLKDIRLVNNI